MKKRIQKWLGIEALVADRLARKEAEQKVADEKRYEELSTTLHEFKSVEELLRCIRDRRDTPKDIIEYATLSKKLEKWR